MAGARGPIVIAGGGIGGLTLAVAWQRRGEDVVVLERRAEVGDVGAGISLWPNALAAMDVLDLGDVVRQLGVPLTSGAQHRPDGRSGPFVTAAGWLGALGEPMVCVDRGELVGTLAALLEPGTVRTSTTVTGYRRTSTSVIVEIADKATMEGAGLIGADGIGSAVATACAGALRFSHSGYAAWRGIADGAHADGQLNVLLIDGHELGWLPVDERRTYWFATAWRADGDEHVDGERSHLADLLAVWPPPAVGLLEHTPDERLVRNPIVDRAPLGRWTDGPVGLLGDAAHPMRPHLGQGGCLAIEDAAAIVSAVGCEGDLAAGLARYEVARRGRADRVVRLSRLTGLTRPPGTLTAMVDRIHRRAPALRLDPALRLLAPVASYGAGARAVDLR